jgi:transmembrane sensor
MGQPFGMRGNTGLSEAELAQLRLEGLEYLNHLQSGAATKRDEADCLSWRRASAAHEEAFRSAIRLQQQVRTVERRLAAPHADPVAGAQVLAFPSVTPPAVARPHLTRRTVIGGAMAASLAGIVATGRSVDMIPSLAELGADFRTGAGERRLVRLAGGATVDLNTRTAIDLRNDLGTPAVELISGEAVFTSGPSPDAAIMLMAGAGKTSAQRARFNARRDGDAVCITCLGGEVEVAWGGKQRTLRTAQEVKYDDSAIGAVASGIDTNVLTAWQSGTLIFHNMAVRDVVAEINRYRPGRVILANERFAERLLSGTYTVRRLDDFFSQAQMGFGVKVMRLPGNVVVLT